MLPLVPGIPSLPFVPFTPGVPSFPARPKTYFMIILKIYLIINKIFTYLEVHQYLKGKNYNNN